MFLRFIYTTKSRYVMWCRINIDGESSPNREEYDVNIHTHRHHRLLWSTCVRRAEITFFMPCFSSHYLLNTLSRLELSSILFSLPFFFSLAGIYFCIILICFGYTRITRWPSALPIRSYISISFVRYAIDSIKCIFNDDHDHQCGSRASHQSRCGWSARRKTCAQKV